jgi:hypothetical protein
MNIKTYKTGIVGRWIGISYIYAHKKIGIGFWFFVLEFALIKKASEK